METRQILSFLKIAQLGSFSRAAQELGYSQSALTVQIRLLEQELGARLFDRIGRQVTLTSAGEHFRVHAGHIIEEMQAALSTTKESGEPSFYGRCSTCHSCHAKSFPTGKD